LILGKVSLSFNMKKFLLLLLLSLIISACAAKDTPPAVTQADLQKILEAEWQTFTGGKALGAGIAIQILSPKGDYFLSTGMGENMHNAYHFRTASVTKTFTAAGIMLLHQQGKLNIDDKITANIPGTLIPYVPYNIPHKDEITIRMILMHRAGVFDLTNENIKDNAASHNEPYVGLNYLEYVKGSDENHQFTLDELFGVIARDQQYGFQPPASQYNYSDTGYSLLGLIMERVSGKTYGDFVRDEFLLPNNLLNTSLPWQGADQTLPAPFVPGYIWLNDALTEVTLANMSPFVANGNMITTPRDLAIWAKRLFTGKAGLTMDTVEMMKTGLPSSAGNTYGLGVQFSEKTGYGHGGDHEGYITLMFYKPEQDLAYVIMVNVWDLSNYPDSIIAQHVFMTATANKIFAWMGF